ncbi:DUF748 domain-containing protein [Duganella qianjiadongensis]|uniref:DUF748 domain-containing protein n=1 Tax=Duganella qianjiadongensis TaxID=2692176 RepID=UPI001E41CB49|nr:DUF748 domain-containing protein [Duganella qianjiadongensis]
MQVFKQRWQRWGAGVAGALGLYALAGGWLLPKLIKSELPSLVAGELERKASVADVRFNPFTLRLSMQQLALTETDGAPLFSLDQLEVELQWRSLLRRAWCLGDIRLVGPNLQLAIAPDGTFNIAQLLATLDKHKKDEPDSGMPRLVVGHFTLEQGKVAVQDRHAGYRDTFAPIDFTLNNLSTLPDDNGDYTLSADAAQGGKLRWKGKAALNPISASGELALENVALAGLSSYLKPFVRMSVAAGRLSATLPYQFRYHDGQVEAGLHGASLGLAELALHQQGAAAPFARVQKFDITGVDLDLAKQTVAVGGIGLHGGALSLRRDARGMLDLAGLAVPSAPVAAPASGKTPSSARAAPAPAAAGWKVHLKQFDIDGVALSALDESVKPALKVNADQFALHLNLQAQTGKQGLQLQLEDGRLSLDKLQLQSGAQTPFKLSRLALDQAVIDLAARRASVGKLAFDGGQLDLSRDSKGQFMFLQALPHSEPASGQPQAAVPAGARSSGKTAAAPAWATSIKRVELNRFGARYDDAATGIKANLQDFRLALNDVSTDLGKAVSFDGALALREGGQLQAQGKVVPASAAVEADLKLNKLAIAPVQPLLAKYLRLKIGSGAISTQGHLHVGAGTAKDPALRYDGGLDFDELVLNEDDGDRFAHWKQLRAEKLSVGLKPDLLDIGELRLVEPDATLIIENDRSFNAARLLVPQPAPAAIPAATSASAAAPAATPFPVKIRRLRLQNAKLAFTDLSLRPQFSAKMYELNGVITGLSSRADASSQVEIDGRVDEYGSTRIRGKLNPFVLADNTDLSVIFKNVDMVSASPYSMKFAGYRIAEGKISLDLQYKVRHGQLEGSNQIVLDKLTLGERIDSPDALKLPLELALAILKDSNGRIELGVPVSGNLNDPQFSYGAVVWKAIGNIFSKIVTSPFRALGSLFAISGDQLEAVSFDAGSARLAPPEREKLKQVAQILAKKPQLHLAVPGQYGEALDGAALRQQAVRRTVLQKAGVTLAADEPAGPLDIGQRKVRMALRDLYGERFGAAALEQQKKAAEAAAGNPANGAQGDAGAAQKLPVLQRMAKLVQGEPQVADASAFYQQLQQRLEQQQALPADALRQLGTQRAAVILAALKEEGVAADAAQAAAPQAVEVASGDALPLKLELSAK